MAKARISRSDNSLKFFMAQLDYQCAGLVPKLEDLAAEGAENDAENDRRGSGVLCFLAPATMSHHEHRTNTRRAQSRTRPTGSRHYCTGKRRREQQSRLTSPSPPENIRQRSCAYPSGSESTLGKSQGSAEGCPNPKRQGR